MRHAFTRSLRSMTLLAAAGLVTLPACRPVETARFTPSAEVAALTDDLDDEEELELFRGLQQKIADVLRQRCGEPAAPVLLGADSQQNESLRRGAAIYANYCVQCHGVNGDGQGELAPHLNPRPRDYTLGIFKFTSTSNGKPRRADLIATLRRGVRGTSMPSFATLSNDELGDVVDYVLALTHRGELQRQLAQIAFDDGELPDEETLDEIVDEILTPWREAPASVALPATTMPPMDAESVAEGRRLFLEFACSRCHGNDGRGGSLGNVDVGVDAWGRKAAAADLTSGMFRGGGRPIDLYRRIAEGIPGTPMPGFGNQFAENPEVIWRLVHFIADTGQQRRRGVLPGGEAPPAATAAPAADAPGAGESTTPGDESAPSADAAEPNAEPEAAANDDPAA